jgi:hypothetical protein
MSSSGYRLGLLRTGMYRVREAAGAKVARGCPKREGRCDVSRHGAARVGGGEQRDGGGTCLGSGMRGGSRDLVSERDVERNW